MQHTGQTEMGAREGAVIHVDHGPASSLRGSEQDGQWGPLEAVSGRHGNRRRSSLELGVGSWIRNRRQKVNGMCPLHLGPVLDGLLMVAAALAPLNFKGAQHVPLEFKNSRRAHPDALNPFNFHTAQ